MMYVSEIQPMYSWNREQYNLVIDDTTSNHNQHSNCKSKYVFNAECCRLITLPSSILIIYIALFCIP